MVLWNAMAAASHFEQLSTLQVPTFINNVRVFLRHGGPGSSASQPLLPSVSSVQPLRLCISNLSGSLSPAYIRTVFVGDSMHPTPHDDTTTDAAPLSAAGSGRVRQSSGRHRLALWGRH